jgi:hypothetical protein
MCSCQALNVEAQDKLWRASLELVGLPAEDQDEEGSDQ